MSPGLPWQFAFRAVAVSTGLTLLLIVVLAGAFGGRVGVRIAPQQSRVVAWLLAATLAITMLWGFSGSLGWPGWWGPAVALMFVAGVWLGGIRHTADRS